jgi:hypothetical protein
MRTALFYTASMVLVAAITLVAALWVHFSHIRFHQGRLITVLWGTHGVHTIDLIALGIELALVTILSITLLAGFSRSQPENKIVISSRPFKHSERVASSHL